MWQASLTMAAAVWLVGNPHELLELRVPAPHGSLKAELGIVLLEQGLHLAPSLGLQSGDGYPCFCRRLG